MTTDLPWRSERALDPSRVMRVVDAQFAHLAPSRARFLAEGWDSEAYLVNDRWILRFPKRREVEASQDTERALLPRLASALPLPIPMPTLLGEPSEEFPFRFFGYSRLVGEPAESFPIQSLDARSCAKSLGAFLSSLHAFPADEVRALGVPERPPPDSSDLVGRLRSRWTDVAPVLQSSLRERAERFFAEATLQTSHLERHLVHDDLRSDHILVRADGSVAGIIDWGDVALGDPAADFAGLLAWLGEPFVRAVLEHYEGKPDPDFLGRARWGAARSSLSRAWAGVRRASPLDVELGSRGLDHALPR